MPYPDLWTPTPPPEPPAAELYRALHEAQMGQMPDLTTDALLQTLQLDGDVPDGLTLIDRFIGDGHRVGAMRAVVGLSFLADGLIRATNEYRANPAQEVVAKMLGAVVTRQIVREQDICPGARELALASTRDDIISPEVRESLGTPMSDEEMLRALLRDFFDSRGGETGGGPSIIVFGPDGPREVRGFLGFPQPPEFE